MTRSFLGWRLLQEPVLSPGMDGEAFFHGAGQGGARPKSKGVGKGSKSAGQGGTRQGTYYVYQLIEIICKSKGNLNSHCIGHQSFT